MKHIWLIQISNVVEGDAWDPQIFGPYTYQQATDLTIWFNEKVKSPYLATRQLIQRPTKTQFREAFEEDEKAEA